MKIQSDNELEELFIKTARQISLLAQVRLEAIIGSPCQKGSRLRDVSDARTLLIVVIYPFCRSKSQLARLFWNKGFRNGDISYHLNKHKSLMEVDRYYRHMSLIILNQLNL